MYTYSDTIEHAIDCLGGAPVDQLTSRIRRAILNAYQRLTMNNHGWRYYIVAGRVNLNGLYETGTIAYTASTRTFAITGGSWPSWAKYGQIRVDNEVYDVESVSGANLVVTSLNSPVANISSGTTYQLFQSQYAVPDDYQDLYIVTGSGAGWLQGYITPESWFTQQRNYASFGSPNRWTIAGSTNPKYGRKALLVDPAPSSNAPHVFLYRRTARPLRLTGQETASTTGTLSISAAGTTVTGSGTSFSSRMIGSVLRVSDSTTTSPDGLAGAEPYTEEFVVKSVASTTSLTIASASVAAYSGVKFRVSDPIDIDDCMISAMWRGIEFEIESVRNASAAALARAKDLYQQELLGAWAIDGQSDIARAGIPLIDDSYYYANYSVSVDSDLTH
jgi:hypothetical protein